MPLCKGNINPSAVHWFGTNAPFFHSLFLEQLEVQCLWHITDCTNADAPLVLVSLLECYITCPMFVSAGPAVLASITTLTLHITVFLEEDSSTASESPSPNTTTTISSSRRGIYKAWGSHASSPSAGVRFQDVAWVNSQKLCTAMTDGSILVGRG